MSEKSSKNIAFRLYDSLVESLDKVANDNGTTRTSVVVQFINEGLERLKEGTTQVIRKQAITSEEVEQILDPLLNNRLEPIMRRIQVLEDLTQDSNLLSTSKFGTDIAKNNQVRSERGAVEEIKILQQQLQQERDDFNRCNNERLEALNCAGLAHMEIKVLKQRLEAVEGAIAILNKGLSDRLNSASYLKEKIREALAMLNFEVRSK